MLFLAPSPKHLRCSSCRSPHVRHLGFAQTVAVWSGELDPPPREHGWAEVVLILQPRCLIRE